MHGWNNNDKNSSAVIRMSSSLQDLTVYRKVSSIEEGLGPLSDGQAGWEDPKKSSPLSLGRGGEEEGGGDVGGGAAAYDSVVGGRSRVLRKALKWVLCVVASSLLVCLVVLCVYLGFRFLTPEKQQYAIVLDCGSTGTRVHVYSWSGGSVGGGLPEVIEHTSREAAVGSFLGRRFRQRKEARAYNRMETEPGLDKLLHNESGVRTSMGPLLQWAESLVPHASQRSTPLFLLATAGVRRLSSADSEWLLDRAWGVLENSPFMCRRSWVKVISGTEEANYGWVALNYAAGRLGHDPRQSTLGALDLGGSSLQVTFETEEVSRSEFALNLTVGTAEHHLYAYSHQGFGLNDAFDKSVALLHKSHLAKGEAEEVVSDGMLQQLHHPCLHVGYKEVYKCAHCLLLSSVASPSGGDGKATLGLSSPPEIELIGAPDWEKCSLLAKSVIVNSSMFQLSSIRGDCEDVPCALGKHQPEPRGQFYALSGFFVVYKFFELPPSAKLNEILKHGRRFCAKTWANAKESVRPQPYVEQYCFRAPYIVALLQEGLHLQKEQVIIGSGNISWTLGAALLEAGALTFRNVRNLAPRRSGLMDEMSAHFFLFEINTMLVFLFILVIVTMLLIGFCYQRIFRCYKKPSSPLSAGTSSPLWLRSSIRSLVNRPILTDGRIKHPHSPVPSFKDDGSRRDLFSFGSPIVGIDDSFLDPIRLPPMQGNNIPFVNWPHYHKGRSQLSSRRTQSRDDLHLYVSDSHMLAKV